MTISANMAYYAWMMALVFRGGLVKDIEKAKKIHDELKNLKPEWACSDELSMDRDRVLNRLRRILLGKSEKQIFFKRYQIHYEHLKFHRNDVNELFRCFDDGEDCEFFRDDDEDYDF